MQHFRQSGGKKIIAVVNYEFNPRNTRRFQVSFSENVKFRVSFLKNSGATPKICDSFRLDPPDKIGTDFVNIVIHTTIYRGISSIGSREYPVVRLDKKIQACCRFALITLSYDWIFFSGKLHLASRRAPL